MILMIDNYDSFTFNIVQYLTELGQKVEVLRNDQVTLPEIERMNPSGIVISPGPCTPDKAGISLSIIPFFEEKIPILGVCLGHQCIGQAYGGKIVKAKKGHAWKDICYLPQREWPFFRNVQPIYGDPLSFSCCRAGLSSKLLGSECLDSPGRWSN